MNGNVAIEAMQQYHSNVTGSPCRSKTHAPAQFTMEGSCLDAPGIELEVICEA